MQHFMLGLITCNVIDFLTGVMNLAIYKDDFQSVMHSLTAPQCTDWKSSLSDKAVHERFSLVTSWLTNTYSKKATLLF